MEVTTSQVWRLFTSFAICAGFWRDHELKAIKSTPCSAGRERLALEVAIVASKDDHRDVHSLKCSPQSRKVYRLRISRREEPTALRFRRM
jgi:hypothetical protein